MVTERAQVGEDICVCGLTRREHWGDGIRLNRALAINGCTEFRFQRTASGLVPVNPTDAERDIELLWKALGKALSLINPKEFRSAADQKILAEAQLVYAQWKEIK